MDAAVIPAMMDRYLYLRDFLVLWFYLFVLTYCHSRILWGNFSLYLWYSVETVVFTSYFLPEKRDWASRGVIMVS